MVKIEKNLISTPRALIGAETVGDLLSLPFPIEVAPLKNPALFKAFAKTELDGPVLFNDFYSPKTYNYSIPPYEALFEPAQIIADHLTSIGSEWKSASFAVVSSRMEHSKKMHADVSDIPDKIIHLVPTLTATLIVPNNAAREIISDYQSLRNILMANLATSKGRASYRSFYDDMALAHTNPSAVTEDQRQCSERLHAALRPVSLDTVHCMSTATLHKQGTPVLPGRVFMNAESTFLL